MYYTINSAEWSSKLLDVSPDGTMFCIGTSKGSVLVYDTTDGACLGQLSHRRSGGKPVLACAFSQSKEFAGKRIVTANTEGLLCRFDEISPETLEEWDNMTAAQG